MVKIFGWFERWGRGTRYKQIQAIDRCVFDGAILTAHCVTSDHND
jgi:hypothetical protein